MSLTRTTVILAAIIVFAGMVILQDSQLTGHPAFEVWKAKYSVSYADPLENDYRQGIYFENLAYIEAENRKGHSYELGENQFMDLKKEEFVRLYLQSSAPSNLGPAKFDVYEIPQNDVDWLAAGAVTSVKNQGSTGSVVPFVATAALEAITKIRDGQLRNLPEKSLEDCVGLSSYYEYFEFARTKGTMQLDLGLDYTYVAKQCTGPFKISGSNNVTSCTELTNNMMAGPVAAAVDATNWQFYKSGILTNCDPNSLNHSALVVTMTDTYWRLKNTWGTSWGESGYIRIGPGNTCGVCRFGSRPK